MAITYGFYNGLNHDRKYEAKDISGIFNGIIRDGIFQSIGTAMVVTAYSGNVVNVGIGRAWFNGTWTVNDAILPITMPASDVILDRIDAIILEVNQTESVRANSVKYLTGTPSSTPVNPTLTKADGVYQYPLCYISRKANSTEITASDITNKVGTSDCPFVTGILDTVNIDTLLTQWDAEFDTWFESIKGKLSGDVATNLQNEIDTTNTNLTATNTNVTTLQNKHAWVSFTIATGSWSSTTTTVDGKAYYTYTISLSNVYEDHPTIVCGAAGTLPTEAEATAFALLKYAYSDGTAKTLKLYAESVPASNFVILVNGVAA